jgi:hypothetical protein
VVVHFGAGLKLGHVVVDHFAARDSLRAEALHIAVDLVRRDLKRHVIHRRDGRREPGPLRGHSRRGFGRVREPEERQRVTVSDVKEEVLTDSARKIDRLDQRHAELVGVEVDGFFHVPRDQSEVMESLECEFLVLVQMFFGH